MREVIRQKLKDRAEKETKKPFYMYKLYKDFIQEAEPE